MIDFETSPLGLGDSGHALYEGFIFVADGGAFSYDPGLSPIEYDGADADREVSNGYAHKYLGITHEDGENFDFTSGYFADGNTSSPFSMFDANTLEVSGYNDGALLYTKTVNLNESAMTQEMFDFRGIDELTIEVTGGGTSGNGVTNTGWYSMDNLEFWI